MKDGLAVAPNERNAARKDTKCSARCEGGLCEDFSQPKIQLAEFACGGGMLLGDAKNLLAQRTRECARSMSK